MVIGSIHISEEVIMATLMLLIGVLGTLNLRARGRAKMAEAKAEQLKAQARTIMADADTKVKLAEAELAERLSLAKTLTQYGQILDRQIIVNQQNKERADASDVSWQKKLDEKEKRDESNYQTLSKTQDRHAAELHEHFKQRFDQIDRKVDDLPSRLADGNKEFARTIAGEFVAQIGALFNEVTMAQEWYPFPDVNDPEWQDEFVKPLVNRVRLYRRPVSSESSVTDIEIPQAGSNMKIIKGRKKGWLVVRRASDADSVYGWVLEHEVLIGMAAVKRATGEALAVALPIPAGN